MALHPKKLSTDLKNKIVRNIRTLTKKGLIDTTGNKMTYHLAYYMDIQIVPKKQVDTLAFSKPEGIRVFLMQGNKFCISVDFLYRGQRLWFSSSLQGHTLLTLSRAIRVLEEKLRLKKNRQEAVLVFFLLCPDTFLMVKDGRKKIFYQYGRKGLWEISQNDLRDQVKHAIEDRPEPSFNHH
jgi:hypothetical protein